MKQSQYTWTDEAYVVTISPVIADLVSNQRKLQNHQKPPELQVKKFIGF